MRNRDLLPRALLVGLGAADRKPSRSGTRSATLSATSSDRRSAAEKPKVSPAAEAQRASGHSTRYPSSAATSRQKPQPYFKLAKKPVPHRAGARYLVVSYRGQQTEKSSSPIQTTRRTFGSMTLARLHDASDFTASGGKGQHAAFSRSGEPVGLNFQTTKDGNIPHTRPSN